VVRATPESKVKKEVKRILDAYAPLVFYRMPVINGMGRPGLDFYGCCCGLHFEIETKANGKDLTARQAMTAGEVEAAFGKFFAICSLDDSALGDLDVWLHETVSEHNRRTRHRFGARRTLSDYADELPYDTK
jgi:hypothetical protein